MLSTDFKKRPALRNRLQQQNHIVQACWPDATLTSCNKLCEQCNPAPTIKQAWSLFRPSHTPSISTCLLVTLAHFSTGRLNRNQLRGASECSCFIAQSFLLSSPEKQRGFSCVQKKKRKRMEHEFEEFGDFLRTPWITTTCDHEGRSEEEEEIK